MTATSGVSGSLPAHAEALRDAACSYTRRGWRVLPLYGISADGQCCCSQRACAKAGKHPQIVRWPQAATTDIDRVRGWVRQWPEMNIGILTGRESGLLVLDIDAPDGEDTVHRLEAEHGPLPATVESLTGGGGRHVVFRHPAGVRWIPSTTGIVGAGVDIRAEKGLIVVEPSRHASGRGYHWECASHPDEVDLADPPTWMLDLVTPRVARRATTRAKHIPAGRRNATLTRRAGSLRRAELSTKSVLAALLAENEERCRPPLSAAEIRRIVRSSERWEAPGWQSEPMAFAAQTEQDSSARLVLLALCHHAGDDGTCHPGVRRLSELTALHRNTVTAAIRRLEDAGWLEVTRGRRAGRNEVNLYRIRRALSDETTESGSPGASQSVGQNYHG